MEAELLQRVIDVPYHSLLRVVCGEGAFLRSLKFLFREKLPDFLIL